MWNHEELAARISPRKNRRASEAVNRLLWKMINYSKHWKHFVCVARRSSNSNNRAGKKIVFETRRSIKIYFELKRRAEVSIFINNKASAERKCWKVEWKCFLYVCWEAFFFVLMIAIRLSNSWIALDAEEGGKKFSVSLPPHKVAAWSLFLLAFELVHVLPQQNAFSL